MTAFIGPSLVLIVAIVLVLLYFVQNKGVPEIRANSVTKLPTLTASADQQPQTNPSPTPTGPKISLPERLKDRQFWAVFALSVLSVIAYLTHSYWLPPLTDLWVGVRGAMRTQGDATSWFEWLQQPTDTVLPGTPRKLLTIIGILIVLLLLLKPTQKK